LPAQRRGFPVRVVLATPQQPPRSGLERDQPPAYLVAVECPCPEANPEWYREHAKALLDLALHPRLGRRLSRGA
jgi:hypothetical protein